MWELRDLPGAKLLPCFHLWAHAMQCGLVLWGLSVRVSSGFRQFVPRCRRVPHCLSILKMLTVYSVSQSASQLLRFLLLNNIRHPWVFGSLWAPLGIWQTFKETPPKPNSSKWLCVLHCIRRTYAHYDYFHAYNLTMKIIKWILVPAGTFGTLNLRARNHCFKAKMLLEGWWAVSLHFERQHFPASTGFLLA